VSTLANLRAKRARELQTELQALAQFRRTSRAHVGAIAKAWRPLSKRLTRALERMNAVLPDELQLEGEVSTPGGLLLSLTEALESTWALVDVLPELRKLGPKLSRIKPVKVRKRAAAIAAKQKDLLRSAHLYEQMAADLADETRFQNRLHNANLGQKLEGKRQYNAASYRVQLAKWLAEHNAHRRAAGLSELS
jgi:hypothetical protein